MGNQKPSGRQLAFLLLALVGRAVAVVVPSIGSGSCTEGAFFDQPSFTCLACPAGSLRTNQDRSCSCAEDASVRPRATPVEVCEACTTFTPNPTQDCLYDSASRPVCDPGFGLAAPTPRKGYSAKKCLRCSPELNATACTCPAGEAWTYPGYCLADAPVTNNLIGSTQSNFADCHLAQVRSAEQARSHCSATLKSKKACSLLANLCVMAGYREDYPACSDFRALSNIQPVFNSFPE